MISRARSLHQHGAMRCPAIWRWHQAGGQLLSASSSILPASSTWWLPPTRCASSRAAVGVAPVAGGGSLQLAAALAWCEERPVSEPRVYLDDRLRDAARREGSVVVPA